MVATMVAHNVINLEEIYAEQEKLRQENRVLGEKSGKNIASKI